MAGEFDCFGAKAHDDIGDIELVQRQQRLLQLGDQERACAPANRAPRSGFKNPAGRRRKEYPEHLALVLVSSQWTTIPEAAVLSLGYRGTQQPTSHLHPTVSSRLMCWCLGGAWIPRSVQGMRSSAMPHLACQSPPGREWCHRTWSLGPPPWHGPSPHAPSWSPPRTGSQRRPPSLIQAGPQYDAALGMPSMPGTSKGG